jgi:hypothetical protein
MSSGKTTALLKMFCGGAELRQDPRHAQLAGAVRSCPLRAGELTTSQVAQGPGQARAASLGALSPACTSCPEAPTRRWRWRSDSTSKIETREPNTEIEVIGDVVQQALGGYHVIGMDSTTATISLDELGARRRTQTPSMTARGSSSPMLRAAEALGLSISTGSAPG